MKSVLNQGAAQRALWAKRLVQDSADDQDPRDVLNSWERQTFFAFDSVQLRIPLLDPVQARRHLNCILGALQELVYKLEQTPEGDRLDLLTIQNVVKGVNQKINAYRSRTGKIRATRGGQNTTD